MIDPQMDYSEDDDHVSRHEWRPMASDVAAFKLIEIGGDQTPVLSSLRAALIPALRQALVSRRARPTGRADRRVSAIQSREVSRVLEAAVDELVKDRRGVEALVEACVSHRRSAERTAAPHDASPERLFAPRPVTGPADPGHSQEVRGLEQGQFQAWAIIGSCIDAHLIDQLDYDLDEFARLHRWWRGA